MIDKYDSRLETNICSSSVLILNCNLCNTKQLHIQYLQYVLLYVKEAIDCFRDRSVLVSMCIL